MKILMHYHGKLINGQEVDGHTFGTINRFCEKDLTEILRFVEKTVSEKLGSGVRGEFAFTFVTPLQGNEPGQEDLSPEDTDLADRIIANICGDSLDTDNTL
jgi:hypothetical protein